MDKRSLGLKLVEGNIKHDWPCKAEDKGSLITDIPEKLKDDLKRRISSGDIRDSEMTQILNIQSRNKSLSILKYRRSSNSEIGGDSTGIEAKKRVSFKDKFVEVIQIQSYKNFDYTMEELKGKMKKRRNIIIPDDPSEDDKCHCILF